MRALGLGVLALLGSAVAAAAQSSAQPVMHRQWVEEQDANGLYPARSTKGRFSITSPIPFNDYSIVADDPNIGRMVMHGLGSRSADGYEFGAIETELTPRMKAFDLADLLAKFAETPGNTVLPRPVERTGTEEVLRASLSGPERSAEMRFSRTATSVFQVICEYPTPDAAAAAAVCRDYIASFRIER